VIVCDQVSKLLVSHLAVPFTVIPRVLYLQLGHNSGAAWGMLPGRRILLCALALAVLAGGIIFRSCLQLDQKWNRVACGLVGGGIAGNLLDRLRLGYVVDFVDLHLPFYRWPTFNIADFALCIGAFLYFIRPYIEKK
jgi:signal peptidase II